jgi:hypothetical protein
VTFALAQQSGGLRRKRKTNLLRRNRLGSNGAADITVLFVLEGAVLSGRRLPRGENPPWGRAGASRWFGEG